MASVDYGSVIFEWDDNKNKTNQTKHGLSFETACIAFFDDNALTKLGEIVDGEQRWDTLAWLDGVPIVFIGHTYQEVAGKEIIRIITARVATKHEQRSYYANNHH